MTHVVASESRLMLLMPTAVNMILAELRRGGDPLAKGRGRLRKGESRL